MSKQIFQGDKGLESYIAWRSSAFPGAVTIATGFSQYELLGLADANEGRGAIKEIRENYPASAKIAEGIVGYVKNTGTPFKFASDRNVAGAVNQARPSSVEICGSWLEACVAGALFSVLREGIPAVISHNLVLASSDLNQGNVGGFLKRCIAEKNSVIVPQGMRFRAYQVPEAGATYFTSEFV